ncbi:hypothetical protein ACVV2G_31445 [Streptomyces ziwulingensis]
MTTALDREAFPLTPTGGRTPYSEEAPSGEQTRPWALRFARVPDGSTSSELPVYGAQVTITPDGTTTLSRGGWSATL